VGKTNNRSRDGEGRTNHFNQTWEPQKTRQALQIFNVLNPCGVTVSVGSLGGGGESAYLLQTSWEKKARKKKKKKNMPFAKPNGLRE